MSSTKNTLICYKVCFFPAAYKYIKIPIYGQHTKQFYQQLHTFTHEFNQLTYLLTYLLTYSMAQSPSSEANWFAASQEIPRIFMEPEGSIPHSQASATCPCPGPAQLFVLHVNVS